MSNIKIAKMNVNYSLKNALSILSKMSKSKFLESVEAHIALYLNTKNKNQNINESVILPYGTGKTFKLLVCSKTKPKNLINNLNIFWGQEKEIDDLVNFKIKYNAIIIEPEYLTYLSKYAKYLSLNNLMPSYSNGTISTNIESAISNFKNDKVVCKNDKQGVIHCIFGNISFSEEALEANIKTLYNSILKSKPISIRGKFIKSIYFCTTMSKSLKIDISSFLK